MKLKLIILALFFVNLFSAQKFFWPKAALSDSAILDKSISSIASRISENYKKPKRLDSLERSFKFDILAGNYKKSIATIQQYREAFADKNSASTKFINYELYAMAKDIEKNEKIDFSKALDKAFDIKYATLPSKYSFRIADVFVENIGKKRDNFKKALGSLKSDSINAQSAIGLGLSYLDYKTSSGIQHRINQLLAQKEKEKYIVETFDFKTKKGGTVAVTVTRDKNNKQPLPAILTNNIYAGSYDGALGKRAVAYDYVGVVVNTRGKRTSPDEIEPFEHEAEDLYDVIDWISKQNWNNGKVGMIGGSYLGFSQWAATKKMHPALKTVIPQVAVGIGIDYPMTNNVFMSYMLQWISYVTTNNLTDEEGFRNYKKWDSVNTAWYKSGKSFRNLDVFEGKKNKIFQRWLDHPAYDKFWKSMVPYKKEFAKINIPVLTTTGFYDADQLGALYYFKEYYKYNKNPNHYMIIGPYDHGGAQSYATNVLRGYTVDQAARINISDLAFSWFDYVMKNGKKPELLKDKVNVQIMDTNEWKHFPSLDASHNSTLKLYLAKGSETAQLLLKEKPASNDFIKQVIDFKDRDTKDVYYKYGKKDSLNVTNMVIYQTPVLDKDIIINGAFGAKLKAEINKKDMDVIISLIQIQPDNEAFYLSNYLGRASYTKNREKRHLLKPGKVETVSIDNPTFVGKKIAKGSRLIVLLGINKTPEYQINYGSGKDVSDETIADAAEPLEIKWFTDSYIELPILQ
ncbi:CocE/NonD family hydrolase [Chryseobacterium daecheongense]|uniref:CocE/NonD family hydrolase n=1 Tax=Chryseobacterium daecheongense TaxID=192389 RepID=UPI001FD63DFB|nr:CocE/NonD family hydrolase [Chryseobacterium daecheongense]UOU98764.1 CocE/NonD family hydrolase [Chryseobacterium daecheongense]